MAGSPDEVATGCAGIAENRSQFVFQLFQVVSGAQEALF
jgi:hypothetical protein